ncbi:MAG: restriction endonuclease subunit S, partial [Carnobacterium sp.]
ATGGTIKHLNQNILVDFPVVLPDKEEQSKIGEYFQGIDNLITLHQCKLEKTKEIKKAYLSEMFPAEGERKPKRRFAGFTDDWEQRKLGEITSLITKGTTPKDKTGNGDVNFIKVENIDSSSGKISGTSKISNEENEGYLKRSQLQENDILFSIAGTLGRVTSVTKQILPANTNQALAIIRLKEGYLDYVKTCLKGNVVEEFIRKNPTI